MNRFDYFIASCRPISENDDNNTLVFKADVVAEVLGFSSTEELLSHLDDEDVAILQLKEDEELKDTKVITHGALYRALFATDKPSPYADTDLPYLRDLVTATIIPSIDENGWYTLGQEELSEDKLALVAQRNNTVAQEVMNKSQWLADFLHMDSNYLAQHMLGGLAYAAVDDAQVYNFNGQSYFSADDVARTLGYSTTKEMVSRLHDFGCVVLPNLDAAREPTIVLTPNAVYAAILYADRNAMHESPKVFQDKVFDEVLPRIYHDETYLENAELADFADNIQSSLQDEIDSDERV